MKLKIYSEEHWLTDEISPDLFFYPFWFNRFGQGAARLEEHNAYPVLKEWFERSLSLFELSTLEECDVAILPINWITVRGGSWRTPIHQTAYNLSVQFAERVKAAGKELIIFFTGDCSDEIVPLDATVFRLSAYRCRASALAPLRIFPMYYVDSIWKRHNTPFTPRQKQDKAVVGFCGFARPVHRGNPLKRLIYHSRMLVDQGWTGVSPYKGQAIRYKALQRLQKSALIDTNLIIRDQSFFGIGQDQQELRKQHQQEFFQNIAESDYVLCCRGSANYSVRFFEVLCCGRIPVFINTDCVLPYEDEIDWKRYCVWVEESELAQIDEKVAEFHERLSPAEFVDLQWSIYQFWKEWLSPEAFVLWFHQSLLQSRVRVSRPGALVAPGSEV